MSQTDGKHARRTGTSSPLGELFDHGCDSINSMMQTVLAVCALQLCSEPKDGWISFVTLLAINGMFFLSIWQQYFTDVLHFQNLAGPTEGQCVCMLVQLMAFFLGPQFLSENLLVIFQHLTSISLPDNDWIINLSRSEWFALKYIIIGGTVLSTIPNCFKCIYDTIQSTRHHADVEMGQARRK